MLVPQNFPIQANAAIGQVAQNFEIAQNLMFGLDEEAVKTTEQNKDGDNRMLDNGPVKLAEALDLMRKLERRLDLLERSQDHAAPNAYTRDWAHSVNHAAKSALSFNKSATEDLPPEIRRSKTLEALKKDPIDQWEGQENLYAFLVTNTETYLSYLSLSKAETAQAIGQIFKASPYARHKAEELALAHLPDQVKKPADRKATYKAIARALDSNSSATLQPLKSNERIIDLFHRARLTFEVERIDFDYKDKEEQLNYLAIEKIADIDAELLPEFELQHVNNWWMTHLMYQVSDSATKTVPTALITNVLANLDKHRSKSKPQSSPRNEIYHVTKDHRHNKKWSNQSNSNAAGFGQPPESLRNMQNTVEVLIPEKNNKMRNQQVAKVICTNMDDFGEIDFGVRLEIGNALIICKLDTGCSVESVISKELALELELYDTAETQQMQLRNADGARITSTRIIKTLARFKSNTAMLNITILDELPSRFLLGVPGMEKLHIRRPITEALEAIDEINISQEAPKNL